MFWQIIYLKSQNHEVSRCPECFDAGIPLEGITQGANDEFFQGNIPVLTWIDTESTYVYFLSEAGDRSADTWQLFMEEQKGQWLRDRKSVV